MNKVAYGVVVHHEFNEAKPVYAVYDIDEAHVYSLGPNKKSKTYCINYRLKRGGSFVAKFLRKEARDEAFMKVMQATPNSRIKLSFFDYFHVSRTPREVEAELNGFEKTLSFPKTVGEQLELPLKLGLSLQEILASDLMHDIRLSPQDFGRMIAGVEPEALKKKEISTRELAKALAKVFQVPGVIHSRGVSKEEFFYFLINNLKRI